MKLIATGPATQVRSSDPRVTAVSPSRELVPVHRETWREYSTILSDTQDRYDTTGKPARGGLVDILV